MTALVSCGKAAKESVPSANVTGDTKPAESRTDDAQKTPEPSGSKGAMPLGNRRTGRKPDSGTGDAGKEDEQKRINR